MKTILSILFLLSVCFVKGQNAAYTTVRSVQDTVITGDSLKINFTYTTTVVSETQIQIMLINNSNGYSQLCINQNYNTIYTAQPICHNDIDGTIYFKVKITPAMGYGKLRVYTTQGEMSTYIKQLSQVGISEYDKNTEIIKTEYYDIYGKEKPSNNEGLTIKVTTYSNGYQKKEKIIVQ